MKRITFLLLVSGLCLLPLAGCGTTPQGGPRGPLGPPPPHWQTLADGVQVLRLFGTNTGPQRPEIALLRLSDARHTEFVNDPMAFVTHYNVFGGKVTPRRVVRAEIPPDGTPAPTRKPGDDWSVALYHMLDCTAAYLDSSDAVY